MENLQEKLVAYGVDMKKTMERFVDDMELYESCLEAFMQDPGFEQLREALAQKDPKAAFEAAHSLKGVAGNLGLTPLFDAVCAVVEPLRAGNADGLEEKMAAVEAEKAKIEAMMQ